MTLNVTYKKSKLKMTASVLAIAATLGVFSDVMGMDDPEHGAKQNFDGKVLFWNANTRTWGDQSDNIIRHAEGNQLETIQPHKEDINQPYRLLSLDGGGQRAEIFLPTLIAIEMLTGKSIYELYDGIGGTSTGGITALGLSYKNPQTGKPMSALDLLKMYHHCSREIFRETTLQGCLGTLSGTIGNIAKKGAQITGIKHDSSGLEKLAQMIVGNDKFQADKFLTDIFIPAVNEGMGSVLEIFSTIDPTVRNAKIWEVLRCTSAAKTFFPPIKLSDGSIFVDGGHMSNHPAADIFRTICENRKDKKGNFNVSIVSLGTGDTTTQKDWDSITSEWVLGKTMGTVQDAFSSQEQSANKQLYDKINEYQNAIEMGADFSKSKLPFIESYLRSQTPPLAPILHEMDKPENTGALFEEGIQQLYRPDCLKILKSFFVHEIPDDVFMGALKNIELTIRKQLNEISINDTRGVSLLSNICAFINSKESGAIKDQSTADLFFNNATTIDVPNMTSVELESAFQWTSRMLEENELHRQDTTAMQKVYSGAKWLLARETSHGMIDTYLKNLQAKVLSRAAQLMRNQCDVFDEKMFVGENLTTLCSAFLSAAKPGWFQQDQAQLAEKAFVDIFKDKLFPDTMKDNKDYKACLVVILDNLLLLVGKHFEASYGVTTGFRNVGRGIFGLLKVESAHDLLIRKLINFREEVKQSLGN